MLSLALAEYQDANQALLSHYGDYEALRRVSMAEDKLKEEIHRMSKSQPYTSHACRSRIVRDLTSIRYYPSG